MDESMHDRVAQLVAELARPIFVFRMARAVLDRVPGAEMRMRHAAEEIDRIVRDYART